MREHPDFRMALDVTGSHPTDLRHYGISSPQGFDPFLSRPYRTLIERNTTFRTDRLFDIRPENEQLLRLLGVRYYMTTEAGPAYQVLPADPKFRLLEPSQSYFKIYELRDAEPAWRFEAPGSSVERTAWTPERREFRVRSPAGGRFALIEQSFPGWRATVDGAPAAIEPWNEAFQVIQVSPGEHRVRFEFRSRGMRVGAAVSLLSLVGLWLAARRK